MRKIFIIVSFLSTVFLGCSKEKTPAPPTITGTFISEFSDSPVLTLELKPSGDGGVQAVNILHQMHVVAGERLRGWDLEDSRSYIGANYIGKTFPILDKSSIGRSSVQNNWSGKDKVLSITFTSQNRIDYEYKVWAANQRTGSVNRTIEKTISGFLRRATPEEGRKIREATR